MERKRDAVLIAGSLSSVLLVLGFITLSTAVWAQPVQLADDPIQNLDQLDVTAKRKGGGADLIIVSSKHLDGSDRIRQIFAQKLKNYLAAVSNPEFQKEFGKPTATKYRIILTCVDEPDPKMLDALARAWPTVAAHHVELLYRVGEDGPYLHAKDITPSQAASASPVSAKPTSKEMEDKLRAQATIAALLRARYGRTTSLVASRSDIGHLQRLVTDLMRNKPNPSEYEAIGLCFGNVLSQETGLVWVAHEDEMGRTLALQYPGTSILVFPKTMIIKRVEDGREVDLQEIFDYVADFVKKNKNNPEYKQ